MANGQPPKDIGQIIMDLANIAVKTSPAVLPGTLLKGGIRAAGAASTLTPGTEREGEGKRVLGDILKELNPLQQNIVKTIQKIDTDNVTEAKAAGVTNEDIAAKAGIPQELVSPTVEPTVPATEINEVTGIPNTELQQAALEATRETPAQRFIGNLLGNLGISGDPSGRLADITSAQKVLGQEPLQAGERETLGLELQKEIVKQTLELSKAGNLKPNDVFTAFNKSSGVFIKMRDAQSRIEASFEDPSAAGDLAMIFNFMKVLDPESTVREGEFANAENATGVGGKIRQMYNKVVSGKKLNKKQRQDFLDRSRRIFQAAEINQEKTTQQYVEIAKRNKLDPAKLIMDVGLAQRVENIQSQPGFQNTPSGNSFRVVQ